jgi:hypothetical protein
MILQQQAETQANKRTGCYRNNEEILIDFLYLCRLQDKKKIKKEVIGEVGKAQD